ncbi:MAG TPA: hypothetical protein VKB95_00785 [Chitinophagaceae bacterium]|nr:hypothetical protein [Chitinophagaceae bacterium]
MNRVTNRFLCICQFYQIPVRKIKGESFYYPFRDHTIQSRDFYLDEQYRNSKFIIKISDATVNRA